MNWKIKKFLIFQINFGKIIKIFCNIQDAFFNTKPMGVREEY
jgi:hypothetical protein